MDIRVYLLNTVTREKIEQKTLEIHPFWDSEKSTVTTSILHLTPWTLPLGVAWSIESTSTGYWPGDLVVTVRYGCVVYVHMYIYLNNPNGASPDAKQSAFSLPNLGPKVPERFE